MKKNIIYIREIFIYMLISNFIVDLTNIVW